ncbi:MAG: hypothetical protein AB1629_00870 [Candidatus Omnitrophota bacterium]
MLEKDVLMVKDIAQILGIEENTIHSRRWQEKSGCPLIKIGKRLYSVNNEFRRWFESRRIKGGKVERTYQVS